MSKTSADLLQALLDRQRAEKQAAVPGATPGPRPVPEPAAKLESESAPPSLPIVEVRPARPAMPLSASPRGITLTFPMFVTALLVIGASILGAFLLGRWTVTGFPSWGGESTSGPTAPATSIARPPSVQPFEWGKKFTVEAMSTGMSEAEKTKLLDLSKYLGKQGVVASAVEVKESGKSSAALFLGSADSAKDKSLVELRDWLWKVPGPDGTGRPFQSAKIRETPGRDKK